MMGFIGNEERKEGNSVLGRRWLEPLIKQIIYAILIGQPPKFNDAKAIPAFSYPSPFMHAKSGRGWIGILVDSRKKNIFS